MGTTTIQLQTEVRDKLAELKIHHGESYNEVIMRILQQFYEDTQAELSSETIKNIRKSLNEIEQGKTSSHKDVKKRLGLK